MSVFFNAEPESSNTQLAELWYLMEHEQFDDAMTLAEYVCQDSHAPIEFFCGLSLAYGENGYYNDAEQTARTAISFGEGHWRARQALAVALMHQGRFLGALDTLGFHRVPAELYVVRAQIEKMGDYVDSMEATLENALEQDVPPAVTLYLAYLYSDMATLIPDWPDADLALQQVERFGDYLDVWERDWARHKGTPYGYHLANHIDAIRRLLR